MTKPLEAITTPTAIPETPTRETVVLYTAQDAQGRLFLTDDRSLLPPDIEDCRELILTAGQVTWALLRVEVEELRGTAVTICVGDYRYATPTRTTALPPTAANRDEKGETL